MSSYLKLSCTLELCGESFKNPHAQATTQTGDNRGEPRYKCFLKLPHDSDAMQAENNAVQQSYGHHYHTAFIGYSIMEL